MAIIDALIRQVELLKIDAGLNERKAKALDILMTQVQLLQNPDLIPLTKGELDHLTKELKDLYPRFPWTTT